MEQTRISENTSDDQRREKQQDDVEAEFVSRSSTKEKADTDEDGMISPTVLFDFEEESKLHLAAIQTSAYQNSSITPKGSSWSALKAFEGWVPTSTNEETEGGKKKKVKRTNKKKLTRAIPSFVWVIGHYRRRKYG